MRRTLPQNPRERDGIKTTHHLTLQVLYTPHTYIRKRLNAPNNPVLIMRREKRGDGKLRAGRGGPGSRGSKYLAASGTASRLPVFPVAGNAGSDDPLSGNVSSLSPAENLIAQGVSTPLGSTSQPTTKQEMVSQARHLL